MTETFEATLTAAAAAIAALRGPKARVTVRDRAAAEAALAAAEQADHVALGAHLAQVEEFVADSGLVSMAALPDRGAQLQVAAHLDVLASIVDACTWLLDTAAAVNYVDQAFLDRNSGQEVARIIVIRPGHPSPHDLRKQAESEAARLTAILERRRDDPDI